VYHKTGQFISYRPGQFISSQHSDKNELSGSVANELSGFMIHLDKQGGGHETDKIAAGDFNVTF